MTTPTNEEPMQHLYGWKWNPRKRRVVDELTEDQARATFDSGPQLGVIALSGSADVPAYTLEMSAAAEDVVVTQFTEGGSVAARLHYRVLPDDPGTLFLTDVSEWLYPDDAGFHSMSRARAYRSYAFGTDGTVELRNRLAGAEAETVEQYDGVDVSDHRVDRISWGEWDRIGNHRPSGDDTATGPGQ